MKIRIDELLVEKKLFGSRSKAQAAIMAGIILADEKKIVKAGTKVSSEAQIRILGGLNKYVSRGGLKLEHAVKEFNISIKDRIAIDVGVSTGGFTDLLLQNGVKKVYAIDVGYGQIAWKTRNDPKVVLLEKTNARNLTKEVLYKDNNEIADLAVMDVSFISIGKILPALFDLLSDEAEVISLVKPQFEAGRSQIAKGGIVKDVSAHKQVLENAVKHSKDAGFHVLGLTKSPVFGADGNKEFFIHLKKGKIASNIDLTDKIEDLTREE